MTFTPKMMTSNTNEWETPQRLFDELNQEFNFTLDPASTDENAKCKNHFTQKENGLAQSWHGHTVFCNPPYGTEIGKWVKKAHDEWIGGGQLLSCLSQQEPIRSIFTIGFIIKRKFDLSKAAFGLVTVESQHHSQAWWLFTEK